MSRQQPPPSTALRDFLATEVAGGLVLLTAAVAAMAWANSPWDAAYRSVWSPDVRHWVNDGLMTVFFLVVGLELQRELIGGELRDRRRATLPVVAAVGGMVVPAALYLAVNPSGPGGRGWGIPMATDIAFALGVAAVVARTLPSSLRLFLLTLAIVDDIGAILVIALFYAGGLDGRWVMVAVVVTAAVYGLRRVRVRSTAAFVVAGVGLWLALQESGLHPTLAGVAIGLLMPTTSAVRLERRLHPWTGFVVVPVFALANLGVSVTGRYLAEAAGSRVTWGVLVGLVLGKTTGITGAAWLACRLGIADRPAAATWAQIIGVAALAGIGFTVSLFMTDLAFDERGLIDEAKVGILAASFVAAVVGAAVLRAAARRR